MKIALKPEQFEVLKDRVDRLTAVLERLAVEFKRFNDQAEKGSKAKRSTR